MLTTRRTWCIVFLLLSWQWMSAQTIELTEKGLHEVKGQMLYLRDEANNLKIDDVLTSKFLPLSNIQKSPSFGFDQASYWFEFTITNDIDQNEWLLEIPYSPLDEIDFYIQPDSGQIWTAKTDGDIFPIHNRDLPHRQPIFKFEIQHGQTKTIYLRIKTISSVQLPVILWTPEAFHIASYKTQMINGLFFGAMFVMIFYQLFLFLSIRDRTTLYYLLTLVSMANILSFFQGYNFLYLHPSLPRLNDDFAALTGPIFMLCSTLLTRSFLKLRQFSKALDIVLISNTIAALLAGLLMVIFHRQISYKYHHLFVFLHCIVILVSAGYCLYKKFRPALFYLIAWGSVMLAAAVFTMATLGLAPGYLGTNYQGLMIGCILQVLLISLALGERWNTLVKENQEAKEHELRRGYEENVRLEREVRLRTEELNLQNVQLEGLNQIKDKLFSVVSHDIKEPLTSLKLSLALVKMDKLTQQEFKDISGELEGHLDTTTDFIQNLLQWAKFQLRGEEIKQAAFELVPLLEETIALLKVNFKEKGIIVKKEISSSDLMVFADIVMTQSILRNLLTNAAKFTPQGGTITVHAKENGENKVVISVTDTGAGIPESNRDKIFTLESIATKGTKSETGTGLGLVLCKEFVEKNNGEIWFDTEQGKGTTFYISLQQPTEHKSKKLQTV